MIEISIPDVQNTNTNNTVANTTGILQSMSSTISLSTNGSSILANSNSTNSIYGTSNSIYGTSNSIYAIAGAEYNILGESVSVAGYKDINLAVIIAQINILGKDYYSELIKQGVTFSEEIETILQRKFKEIERDKKIDLITKKD
jgi:hypothetical protein